MKILHINNQSNTAVYLRDCQQLLGHEATILQTYPPKLKANYPEDYRFPLEGIISSIHLLELVRAIDILHIHGYLSPKVLKLLRLLKRPMILHFHGSEVRSGQWRQIAPYANRIILSTPELQTDCPDGIYIPNPYADPLIRVSHGNSHPVRVVHAYNNDRGVKTIREIVGQVDGAELVEVTQLPHSKALPIYSTCHIAIDQFTYGWYGLFAIECMMMGIPTIGWIDTRYAGNPLYHADEQNAVWALRSLVGDPEERERVGLRQQDYVKRIHDPMRITKRIMEIYDG